MNSFKGFCYDCSTKIPLSFSCCCLTHLQLLRWAVFCFCLPQEAAAELTLVKAVAGYTLSCAYLHCTEPCRCCCCCCCHRRCCYCCHLWAAAEEEWLYAQPMLAACVGRCQCRRVSLKHHRENSEKDCSIGNFLHKSIQF